MEKCAVDCKLGCNGSIPRIEHYSVTPKGRRRPDSKT